MQLFPAIDLLDGKVVRLAQGDYDAVTRYSDDPVSQALQFKEQGAKWIHVVDLNGARSGDATNSKVIRDIVERSGLSVEVGGGIRSLEVIERYAKMGAARLVIGTKLVTDPDFAKQAAATYGDLICAGVDARDGIVAIQGWREGSTTRDIELIEELKSWGIQHLVYTDIAKDGMQTGIDAKAYERIAQAAGFAVTASGGISTLEDLTSLAALGDNIVEAAITGRAIYEGNFTVKEAVILLASA